MSDSELRKILKDVIDDLDSGRVRQPGRRPLRRMAGTALLAAGLGMGGLSGLSGCIDRAIGEEGDASTMDARVKLDSGPMVDYGEPFLDGGILPPYSQPFLDAGSVLEYGGPFPDGGLMPAYGEPFIDGGSFEDYAAPPVPPDDSEP